MGSASAPSTVSVSLVFLTEGRGTRDSEVVATTELPSIHPGSSAAFEFTLPLCPYSFSGSLISVMYRIEASSDEEEASLDIVVSPIEREVRLSSASGDQIDAGDQETTLE
jgi:hypothetical protein